LTKLEDECGVDFHVRQDELELGSTASSLEELKSERPKVRINKLLQEQASKTTTTTTTTTTTASSTELPTRVNLRFLCNPIRFQADKLDPSKLGSVVCERTRLEGGPGAQRAVGTGEEETLPAQLVSTKLRWES
jgi:adrenodoxin-NADP+ reductase